MAGITVKEINLNILAKIRHHKCGDPLLVIDTSKVNDCDPELVAIESFFGEGKITLIHNGKAVPNLWQVTDNLINRGEDQCKKQYAPPSSSLSWCTITPKK